MMRVNGRVCSPMPRAPRARLSLEQIESLFVYIKHGDADHQAWLKEALVSWSTGGEPPPVRGAGRKEAEISRLAALLVEKEELIAQLSNCPNH